MATAPIQPGLARNLETVGAHMAGEASDPASIMHLYTDDVVLEVPGRGVRLSDKPAIEANYRRMFNSMADITITPVARYGEGDWVVDDCIACFRLVGDGMVNAPVPIGSKVRLRLIHLFMMRNGLISRETVFESWELPAV
ncbi:MAG: nuclear transport factor 2 family protein [Thermaurantiacus sp.]